MVLVDIDRRLQSYELTLKDFDLPQPTNEDLQLISVMTQEHPVLIQEELNFDHNAFTKLVQEQKPTFTQEQQLFYDTVMGAVEKDEPTCIFLDARGGWGKTYILNATLSAVRTMEPNGCVALAMATTGIAANLLNLGRTFHSRLKASLTPTQHDHLNISAQSILAKLINMAKLLIIDEATMLHRYHLEAMDATFRDIMSKDSPFGGKIIILSGDVRQCLPVVPTANRAQMVDSCINRSSLWKHFKVMHLTINMRVKASGDPALQAFDQWTCSVGDGEAESSEENTINIKHGECLHMSTPGISPNNFVQLIFPDMPHNFSNTDWLKGRAILAPTHKSVNTINNLLVNQTPGAVFAFFSSDMLDNPADTVRFNVEYLNTLAPTGMPTHKLQLKTGMPVMLLRNLNAKDGLCNGTKLIFNCAYSNKLLQCSITDGQHAGRSVLIPRVQLNPKEGLYPFPWTRRQFPLRPAYSMTINKSQGQTLKHVGIWLQEPVFSHGQLYVAISRVGCPLNLHFALTSSCKETDLSYTRNVVYREVLCNTSSKSPNVSINTLMHDLGPNSEDTSYESIANISLQHQDFTEET